MTILKNLHLNHGEPISGMPGAHPPLIFGQQ
jgi:hypothetical protein